MWCKKWPDAKGKMQWATWATHLLKKKVKLVLLKAASALHNSNELSGFQISGATEEKQEINSHYIALCKRKKERKKISWPIAQYNNEMEHTIGLSEYDGIRKMLNINYKGKVPSKAAVAENWKDLIIRKFSMLFIDLPNFSACTEVV